MRSRHGPWDWSVESTIFSCSMIDPGHPWVTIERQRVLMFETNVNEMNVEPVDLGDEVRQGFQLPPRTCANVLWSTNTAEFLNRHQLHALD